MTKLTFNNENDIVEIAFGIGNEGFDLQEGEQAGSAQRQELAGTVDIRIIISSNNISAIFRSSTSHTDAVGSKEAFGVGLKAGAIRPVVKQRPLTCTTKEGK